MPLEKSASYWADLVHADHPHKPLPANTGQQKGTLTKRQRGSRLDAKNTPQGVIIASEFTAAHRLISTLDAAMILLNPIVEISIGPVAHSFAEFGPDCPWVTVVPVRRHPGWRDAGNRLGGLEERLGGRHVAGLAQHDVHQRVLSAFAPEVCLV